MNIHLRKAGVESGPFSVLQVQSMWQSGALTADMQWRWDAEQIWRAFAALEIILAGERVQQDGSRPSAAPQKSISPLAVVGIIAGGMVSMCFFSSLMAVFKPRGATATQSAVTPARSAAHTEFVEETVRQDILAQWAQAKVDASSCLDDYPLPAREAELRGCNKSNPGRDELAPMRSRAQASTFNFVAAAGFHPTSRILVVKVTDEWNSFSKEKKEWVSWMARNAAGARDIIVCNSDWGVVRKGAPEQPLTWPHKPKF